MKRKLFMCGFSMVLAFSVFITSTVVLAASEKVTEEQIYTTTTKNDAYPFASEIEQNGITYELSNITYDTKPEIITVEQNFEHLRNQEVKQEMTVDRDGKELVLQLTDVRYEPVTFPTGERITITSSTDFGYSSTRPNIPKTKEIIEYFEGIKAGQMKEVF